MNTGEIVKSIRFDEKTVEKVQKLADESERNFSAQVRYMITKYIEITERK